MRQKKFWLDMSWILPVLALAVTLPAGAGAASKYKVLHSFKGGTEIANPIAGVIFDSAGNLYGTTPFGGWYGSGTVFKLTPDSGGRWAESVLHSFKRKDGELPLAGLTLDGAGNLYGTTSEGGANGFGTVFKLTPNSDGSWTESVLYSFTGGTDGGLPRASLIFDADGNLYSTTQGGGADSGNGTVFKLMPNADGSWTESVLYSFAGGTDGAYPSGGLIFDAAGNLYGTTLIGGSGGCNDSNGVGCGTVFKLSATGKETVLHSFTRHKDGAHPRAALIFDAAGSLYGTTSDGGVSTNCTGGCGTVFKLKANSDGSWTESVLHTFKSKDGESPFGDLIFDATGNLYGTTYAGGPTGFGTVFKLKNSDGSWAYSVLHVFLGKPALRPWDGLVLDKTGSLYGTAAQCNSGCAGVVFKITP